MDLVQFIGRFHVLVLHLPIGILLMAAALEVYSALRNKERSPMLNAVWLWGFISALCACALGYMLSLGGEYKDDAIQIHKYYGISVATCALICWLLFAKSAWRLKPLIYGLGSMQLYLLFATGHYGANMTHGPSYLFEYAPDTVRAIAGMPKRPPMREKPTSLAQADAYHDVIAPMLKQRCTSCHNPDKTKGGLDLSHYDGLLKGGKSGLAIDPGALDSSELIRRITLDHRDKKYMPADGKTPLDSDQIDVLSWWVSIGAPQSANISELDVNADQRKKISTLLGLSNAWPLAEIGMLNRELRLSLERNGFVVKQIAKNINYVDLDYSATARPLNQEALDALLEAKDHIAWLNLSGCEISDDMLTWVAKLPNLLKLRLERNPISSIGIAQLSGLRHLHYLNLYATEVDNSVFESLQQMLSISSVYLAATTVSESAIKSYIEDNKKVRIVGTVSKIREPKI